MNEDVIDQETAMTLYAAAVAGAPFLAIQLERLGWSDPESSLQQARVFRRDLLAAVDRAKRGDLPSDPG